MWFFSCSVDVAGSWLRLLLLVWFRGQAEHTAYFRALSVVRLGRFWPQSRRSLCSHSAIGPRQIVKENLLALLIWPCTYNSWQTRPYYFLSRIYNQVCVLVWSGQVSSIQLDTLPASARSPLSLYEKLKDSLGDLLYGFDENKLDVGYFSGLIKLNDLILRPNTVNNMLEKHNFPF